MHFFPFARLARFRVGGTVSNAEIRIPCRHFSCAVAGLALALGMASASEPVVELSPVTVTGTREEVPLTRAPASIGIIDANTIRDIAPIHPGELLGEIPGVAVAVTNGEGHTTAIRQPFTTGPVYLFLEDGVPIRATGFFNHNALYEVNIPTAGGIEVVRGPGTALYGSDAIGGIINILSRVPTPVRHVEASFETGAFGTWRALGGIGGALSGTADAQVDVNRTHVDGWRDRTAYDRRSANLRIDQRLARGALLKTVVAYSKIDQQTGANSPLPIDDYLHHPTRNNFPIGFRNVSAVRISMGYEREIGESASISLIPYFRDNSMDLNGTYNLSSDPRIEHTHNVSYGVLTKWRRNFEALDAQLIAGLDFDYSPGSRVEGNLHVTRSGTGAHTLYTSYAIGTRIYDYRATFRSVSPYVHVEFSPLSSLRFTAGIRYDELDSWMRNNLPAGVREASVLGATRYYAQGRQAAVSFSRISPKVGATYAINSRTHAYASYHFGFRVPSESQLYRAGNEASAERATLRSRLAVELKPISGIL